MVILIIEDDEVIFNGLKKLFEKNGYQVLDGRCGNLSEDFDLAVLDIALPESSGYDICLKIRETKKCPILFLTSMISMENELKGFAVGGDDYIRKPFNAEVLLARVARLLKSGNQEKITRGSMILDLVRMEVKNGELKTALSKTEFLILKTLSENARLVSQKEIILKLWDSEAYIDENALYVNMNRLRDKLRDIGLDGIIVNVRGAGYRLKEKHEY